MSNEGPTGRAITFLVAAWEEEENVVQCLESYSALTYWPKEMVICAGGADRTWDLAKEHVDPTIVVVRQEKGEGKQRALRKAFPYATGEIIVLTDADCRIEQTELLRLLAPLHEDGESVVNGSCMPLREQMTVPFVVFQYAAQRMAEERLVAQRYHRSLLGRNCAILTQDLRDVGAFDEDVAIGTDAFLARKLLAAARRIRFVPSRVRTAYPTSVTRYARQRSRWWRNRILMALRFRRYPQLIRAILPVSIGFAMLVLPIIALAVPGFIYLWVILATWSYTNRLRALRFLAEREGSVPKRASWHLPVSMAADSYASLMTIYHLLFPRLRRKW